MQSAAGDVDVGVDIGEPFGVDDSGTSSVSRYCITGSSAVAAASSSGSR